MFAHAGLIATICAAVLLIAFIVHRSHKTMHHPSNNGYFSGLPAPVEFVIGLALAIGLAARYSASSSRKNRR